MPGSLPRQTRFHSFQKYQTKLLRNQKKVKEECHKRGSGSRGPIGGVYASEHTPAWGT